MATYYTPKKRAVIAHAAISHPSTSRLDATPMEESILIFPSPPSTTCSVPPSPGSLVSSEFSAPTDLSFPSSSNLSFPGHARVRSISSSVVSFASVSSPRPALVPFPSASTSASPSPVDDVRALLHHARRRYTSTASAVSSVAPPAPHPHPPLRLPFLDLLGPLLALDESTVRLLTRASTGAPELFPAAPDAAPPEAVDDLEPQMHQRIFGESETDVVRRGLAAVSELELRPLASAGLSLWAVINFVWRGGGQILEAAIRTQVRPSPVD